VVGTQKRKCVLKYDMHFMWECHEWVFRQYSQCEEKNERKVTKDYAEYIKDFHQGIGPLGFCQSKDGYLNS
jgi:hypothetical protein